MATFKVSVLVPAKAKSDPTLVEVSRIVADRAMINASAPPKDRIFNFETYGIAFYNDTSNVLFGSTAALVAFFPGTDWVVESV